jgi:leucine efflux protein
MGSVSWIGFCMASVAVVLAPGPGSMFVARTAAGSGARAGLRAMLGIMAGDACLIALSLLGVSALFRAHPSLFHAIRLVGAGYLIWLGLQSILAKPKPQAEGAKNGFPIRRALAISLLNPKAVFFFMAFFPVFITSAEHGLWGAYAAMAAVFMVISATYLSFLSHVSSRLSSTFRENARLQGCFRKLSGVVFIGFGLKVATASR